MYWTAKSIALLGLCATAVTVSGNIVKAATFDIVGGAPLSAGPTPLYGSALPQNNVVNSPGAPPTGALVFDPTGPNVTSDTPWVQGGQLFANFFSGAGSIPARISWVFLGSESGFDITLHVPGLADFTEGNQNNSAYSGTPPLPFAALGITTPVAGAAISFSLSWAGSIDNNTPQPSPGPGSASVIFSYAFFVDSGSGTGTLELTKSVSDFIVFALNDGGADNDHDDFVGVAFISQPVEAPQATPIPGALPLFGSVLGGGLLLHRWRKRRSASARA